MEKRSKEKIIPLEIYTDGSLKKMGQQSTFGGWAFCVVRDSKELYHKSGSVGMTTNQRMELLAILEALKYAQNIRQRLEKVIIYSDSAYAINCYLKEWYVQWQNNGWRNASKQPVANQDLWEKLIPFFECPLISFAKVKGHSDNKYNNIVDELAVSYRMG